MDELQALQTRRLTIPEGPVWLDKHTRLTPLPRPWPKEQFCQQGILGGRAWRWPSQPMTIMATLDDTPRHGVLLHVSLAHRTRLPSWAEVKLVRDTFFPSDIDVMMVLPRSGDYVNLHQFTFQLLQAPTPWLMQ